MLSQLEGARGLVWGLANLIGGVLIALPDTGPRLFSLSRLHGPSTIDGVGAVILTGGWVVLDVATWARRRILRRLGVGWLAGGAVAAAVGVAILVSSILLDLGYWWVLGVALLAGVQVAAAVAVTRGRALVLDQTSPRVPGLRPPAT